MDQPLPHKWLFSKEGLDQNQEAAHERAAQILRDQAPRLLRAEPRPLQLKEGYDLVNFYAWKLTELCKLSSAPSEVQWTALVFFRRFFATASPMEFDPLSMIFACVHVACKVEEMREITLDKLLEAGGVVDLRTKVTDLELELLQGLEFELMVEPKIRPSLRMLTQECRGLPEQLEELLQRAEAVVFEVCATSSALLLFPPSALIAAALDVALEEAGTKGAVLTTLAQHFKEKERAEFQQIFTEAVQAMKQMSCRAELNREAMQDIAKAARKCQKAFERIREEQKQRHEARCTERKRRRNDAKAVQDLEELKRKAHAIRGDRQELSNMEV
mmetsp:Transcript_31131/g.58396  ORF Transcript_31131/g.58396 Transcript_31131/m.58396 type:complete len:330 (+) Transcript_31131:57-1046(+)